ncbi:MAG TPA: DUF4236 domain-containing protein [Solirubrobacterales bacterium]|nr:DUF4236 domain-containing protein [Solirubrobacterales bacterium]
MSFKLAPGVRVRASSRGLSAGFGPRAARVHVGSRGVGVSSGVGPFSTYQHLSGGSRSGARSGVRRSTGGPTKASIAAYERQLKAAQREADIERVAALERELVSAHRESFPKAARNVLPPPEAVDSQPIRVELEAQAGIPALIARLGGGDSPPAAPAAEPVDRYQLMRESRKRKRQGIAFWRIRDQIKAAREADAEAQAAAAIEAGKRNAAQAVEQQRLDGLWDELQQARAAVAEDLPGRVAAEKERREAARAAEQQDLDGAWAQLQANDPELTLPALEAAFADNEAPAAAIDCEGRRTTVVMQFPPPEAIVPERRPAHTPTGKPTLKKRTKTEMNGLYLDALGSNVLATMKEAFAVAPGTEIVQLLVIRRETDKKNAGQLAAIYAGEFNRGGYENASWSAPGRALPLVPQAMLNLKGKTEQVAPLDLREKPELAAALEELDAGLKSTA